MSQSTASSHKFTIHNSQMQLIRILLQLVTLCELCVCSSWVSCCERNELLVRKVKIARKNTTFIMKTNDGEWFERDATYGDKHLQFNIYGDRINSTGHVFASHMNFQFVLLGRVSRVYITFVCNIQQSTPLLTLVGTLAINKYIRTGVKTCERKITSALKKVYFIW